MGKITIRQEENIYKESNKFSIKRGFIFLIKANVSMFCMLLVFMINITNLRGEGLDPILTFSLIPELFIILLSLIACLKPRQERKKQKNDISISKNEWFGLGIAAILLSLLSLIFLGLGTPWPSSLVDLILVTNFMVAFYSIFAHPVALTLYEANVFGKKETISDYTFKYIAICFSGINYYVQLTLLKLPLVFNKLLAIMFVLFLVWQSFMVSGLFD